MTPKQVSARAVCAAPACRKLDFPLPAYWHFDV